jgi:hypothetical protein
MPATTSAERRLAPRLKTFQHAEMTLADDTPQRVHLLNLSTGGALVYGAAPAIGTQVTLDGEFAIGRARVAWRRGRCFGIAFERPLPVWRLAALIDKQRQMVEASTTLLRERLA